MRLSSASFFLSVGAGGNGTSPRTSAAAVKVRGRVEGYLALSIEFSPDVTGTCCHYASYDNIIPHDHLQRYNS
jgi:hypothetical protein